ncbi:MAG TPA: hypothetical protein VMF69_17135 [Gemmataceae bacterium]|nr:hypothetical protein [Gemmataceae bacterium]
MVVLRKLRALGSVRTLFVAGLLTSFAASSGCQTAAGTGAAAGAAAGYGAGALIGHNPFAALVGAAFGTVAGLAGGSAIDAMKAKKAQNAANAAAADAVAHAPTLEEIVYMTQNAVPPQQIIEQIRSSGVIYRLNSDQIVYLNRQGVAPPVINALLDSGQRMAPLPPPYPGPAYPVVQPGVGYVAPTPVVGVGVMR